MSNPRTPAHQLYYGPMYGDELAQQIPHLGGQNPATVERMRKNYGRYLSGFGGESPDGAVGYDPRYQGQEIYDLEGEDDTFGSGIFDPEGRGGTANANMGVFASHDSLPGFIARDVPFTVQNDVTDITDNAAVVSVPGGGMAYVEKNGRPGGAAVMGPTWRPPQIEPAGYTRHDQVYAFMNKPGQRGHDLFPGAPLRRQPPLRRPARTSTNYAERVPWSPSETSVPFDMQGRRVPTTSIVHGTQLPVPIRRYADPVSPAAPGMPMEPQVPFTQTVNVATEQIAIDGFGRVPSYSSIQHRGRSASLLPPGYLPGHRRTPGGVFGAELPTCPPGQVPDIDTLTCVDDVSKESPSATQLAMYGLLAGVGVGLVVGVMRMKK